MKKAMKTLFNFISLMAIAFVFFTNWGTIKSFVGKRIPHTYAEQKQKVVARQNYNIEDKEIRQAMNTAYEAAYQYASDELDNWIDEMMSRADNEFLEDYFGLMQSKKRELLSLYNTAVHFFNKYADSAEEAALRELENEISRKVIKPELSQARIENITNQALNVYAITLDNKLIELQEAHNIPTPVWNKYIAALSGLTLDAAQKSYPIAFKTAVVSGAVMTGMIAAPIVKTVATKVSTRMAGKIVATAGAKTAGKVAANAGSKATAKGIGTAAKAIPYIGWGVTAVICVWDIVDYAKNSYEGKRLLRTNLQEYFNEIKNEMLGNNESSIMGTITLWENSLKEKNNKALQQI